MHKRILAIVTLLCAIPLLAYAGIAGVNSQQINTWVMSGGGTLQVDTNYPLQTVTAGSLWNSYSSSQNNQLSLTITPNTGYFVNSLIIDGVPQSLTSLQAAAVVNSAVVPALTFSLTDPAPSVWVSFLRQQLTFTVNGGAGYIVFPSGAQPNVYAGATYRVFEFIPAKGQYISAITPSSYANITYTTNPSVLPAAVGQKVIVTVSSVTGNVTLSGTAGGTMPSLTNQNGTSNAAANRSCDGCHAAQGLDPGYAAIYQPWSSSIHNTYQGATWGALGAYHLSQSECDGCHNIQCAACHQGASTGAHPGQPQCGSCHNTNWQAPTLATWNSSCAFCHTPAGTGDIHSAVDATNLGPNNQGPNNVAPVANNPANPKTCVSCHSVAIPQHALHDNGPTLINDNNGVRAITGNNGEFEGTASTRQNSAGYRSHHIYNGPNVDPVDAQCIACHLEGNVVGGAVVIDTSVHMTSATIYLRNGNTAMGKYQTLAATSATIGSGTNANASYFAWVPATPNHTLMDQFCESCHNGAGAPTAVAAIGTVTVNPPPSAQTAGNPFGDQLTNAYDQMKRPAVVNVFSQFSSTNHSHHAVRAAKYTGRSRVTPVGGGAQIKSPTTFANNSGAAIGTDIHYGNNGLPYSVTNTHSGVVTNYNVPGQPSTFIPNAYQVFGTYSTTNGPASGVGPKFPGVRSTIYDAGLFVATYTTLNGVTLGDDSTLHCGDCHSVGQFSAGSAKAIQWNTPTGYPPGTTNSSTGYSVVATTAVIGAHGSQNDYMLRTSNGSDSLQTQSTTTAGAPAGYTEVNGTYVCFLCHTQYYYGDNSNVATSNVTLGTGAVRGDFGHGGGIGPCNGNAYSGYGKKGTARYGVIVSGTATPSIGNLFAMSCAHCHNSGQQNFGGIHGATGSYVSYSTNGTDVAGNSKGDFGQYANYTSTAGIGHGPYSLNVSHKNSYRFMGGESIRYNGGATASKWEAQTLGVPHREGCYNISDTTDATHLWNTTQPMFTAKDTAKAAIVNNQNGDSSWGLVSGFGNNYTATNTDQGNRYATNNATSGWGSCNHHQGSTTIGPTSPTRVIQRPLSY